KRILLELDRLHLPYFGYPAEDLTQTGIAIYFLGIGGRETTFGGDSFAIPAWAHVLRPKSHADCSRLPGGIDEFPYSCEMMIVVFGDKIQMVHEPHRRLQTR